METKVKTLIGIYQITDLSCRDAFGQTQEDRDRFIGKYFTFESNATFYTRKSNDWVGCDAGVTLILHPDHPDYWMRAEPYTFYQFKFKRVL